MKGVVKSQGILLASLSESNLRHVVTLPYFAKRLCDQYHQYFEHLWGNEYPAVIASYFDVHQGSGLLTSQSYSSVSKRHIAIASKHGVPMEPQHWSALVFKYIINRQSS